MSEIIKTLTQRISEFEAARLDKERAWQRITEYEKSLPTETVHDELLGEDFESYVVTPEDNAHLKSLEDQWNQAADVCDKRFRALFALLFAITDWSVEQHEYEAFQREKDAITREWRNRSDPWDYEYLGSEEPWEDGSPQMLLLDALVKGWKSTEVES